MDGPYAGSNPTMEREWNIYRGGRARMTGVKRKIGEMAGYIGAAYKRYTGYYVPPRRGSTYSMRKRPYRRRNYKRKAYRKAYRKPYTRRYKRKWKY